MKLLLKILIGLVALLLVLVLVGFALPAHFRVERTTVIHASPESVYRRVGDLKAWKTWGV